MKYRKLRPNDKMRVGDWVILKESLHSNNKVPHPEHPDCALFGWVKLKSKGKIWPGVKVKDSKYNVLRKVG